MDAGGRPSSFMANILALLEVFLVIIAAAIVALGLASGLDGWPYLALAVVVVLAIVEVARRNHRRELELHRPGGSVLVPPVAPRVPVVPSVPTYSRSWETRAPTPPSVTFPREAGAGQWPGNPAPPGPGPAVCRSCGSPLRPGARFCHRCGRSVYSA